MVPGIKIAWAQGQVLFQEALTHAMSDEEELGYLSEIDVAVDCFAYVSALNTYPQNRALQAWLINGYMLMCESTSSRIKNKEGIPPKSACDRGGFCYGSTR